MSHYAVVNPATGETLHEYPDISDSELETAIGSAHEAYTQWSRKVPVADRAALIARVAELHSERREALARTHPVEIRVDPRHDCRLE